MKYLVSIAVMLLANSVFATTWTDSEVDDPLKPGEKCSVKEPMSSGSYIYRWPSKYDQVFWPYTDRNSIWYCKSSGFISFMSDFEEIKNTDLESISKYLKSHNLKNPSVQQMIETLEDLNEHRDFSAHYQNMLTRVYARWYQAFGETEKAAVYRKKAFKEIEAFLKTELTLEKKLEYLYLASNYSRYFGDATKSDNFLEQLKTVIEDAKDTEYSGYSEYLSELLADTMYIIPGEAFDPVVPAKINPH